MVNDRIFRWNMIVSINRIRRVMMYQGLTRVLPWFSFSQEHPFIIYDEDVIY